MADEVVLKLVLESDIANKSVGELKQNFRDLTNQINNTVVGTKEYKQTLQSLGVVKGGLTSLRQQILALNPERQIASIARLGSTVASGFAAAQAAQALFGAESEDLMKVLVKVQAATALASGLQGLAGLSKAIETARLAMIAFSLSNPFTAIAAGIVALMAIIGGLVTAYRSANSEVTKIADENAKLNKVYETQKFYLTEEVRLLEAVKGREEDVIKKKRELIIIAIKEIQLSIALAEAKRKEAIEQANLMDILAAAFSPALAILRKQQRIKEAEDEVKENKKKLETIKNDLTINLIQENEIKDKNAEKRRKINEEARAKKEKEEGDANSAITKAHLAANEKELNDQIAHLAAKKELDIREAQEFDKMQKANDEATKQMMREDLERTKLVYDTKLGMAAQTFGAIGNLALAFAGQNEKGAKRAFEINKAASIAQAIIATYQGANAIFANAALNPTTVLFPAQPFIMAGLAIAAGLANVAVIAKTQFKGGGGGGSVPSFGGGSAPSIESPQGQTQLANKTTTQVDEEGMFQGFNKEQSPLRAYVVETDITSKQKNIQRIENNSKF